MTRAKGKAQNLDMSELIEVKLVQRPGHRPATLMIARGKAYRLKAAMMALEANTTYLYEQADGSKIMVQFCGLFDGLNAPFYQVNQKGEPWDNPASKQQGIYFAPVVDMGDGSLFTDHLTKLELSKEK